jgi:serine/threonine protein kinase
MPDPATDPNRDLLLQLVENRSNLGGRFNNIQRINPVGGGGWFSLVFSADDATTGASVVLKVFHPGERGDAYRWDCFQRESTIAHALSGEPDVLTCVCSMAEFFEDLPTPVGPFRVPFAYYASERAECDLETRILHASLTAEQSLVAFRAMCRSVQRIHSRHIAHRDLKPGNFLIKTGGAVKLADFGTARDFSIGTPLLARYDYAPGDTRYTAPEMLAGVHSSDPEVAFVADIYSLGACLFELFTGTVFSLQVFDPMFAIDLGHLTTIRPADRKLVFDDLVPHIADGHRLPGVQEFGGAHCPASIVSHVNALYRGMASLDYRERLVDYSRIFRQIDVCLLILRNQAKYDEWRKEKLKRAENRRNADKNAKQETS